MNDFDWKTGEPSIFLQDPYFNRSLKARQAATKAVKEAREQNKDNSTLYGMSKKADAMVYQFKLSMNTPIMSREESDRTISIRNSA